MKGISRRKKGFTLVELLVVIAIIAILAAVVVPTAFSAIDKSKVSAAEADFKAIKTAAMNYYADTGSWPISGASDVGFVTKPTVAATSQVVFDKWHGPYMESWKGTNPWGGTYTYVKDGAAFGGTNNYITLTSVPADASSVMLADLGANMVKVDTTTTTTVYLKIK